MRRIARPGRFSAPFRAGLRGPSLRPWLAVLLFAGLAVAWQGWRHSRLPTLSGAALAIDGDSLRLDGLEIRLAGIDAPELAQWCEEAGRSVACGRRARAALVTSLSGGPVMCRIEGSDRYGRALGRCQVSGIDLNAALVRSGEALAYGDYASEEAEAQAARRGVWAGQFERPQDWRRHHPRLD